MTNTAPLQVRPLLNYSLLGTGDTLDKNKIYFATVATNIPRCEEDGLIFVENLLLKRGEYEIINQENDPRMEMRGTLGVSDFGPDQ